MKKVSDSVTVGADVARYFHVRTPSHNTLSFYFLAQFGGIFGLCIGGSLTSLIEIIYFCVKYHLWNIFYAKQGVVPTIIRVGEKDENGLKNENESRGETHLKSHRAPIGEPMKLYWN